MVYTYVYAAPLDYEESDGLLQFNESIQSHTVFFSIINDNILERNETFVLRITSLTDQIETGPSEAMVTILDDDCKSCIASTC